MLCDVFQLMPITLSFTVAVVGEKKSVRSRERSAATGDAKQETRTVHATTVFLDANFTNNDC